MWKPDLVSVQTQPLKFPAIALNVTNNRMADEFAVNAKLISTARNRFEFE